MAATRRRCAAVGSRCAIGWPSSASVPASGVSAPVRILISVDLPAPFSPTSAWTSPARRSNDTPLSARTPANDLTMPSSSRIVSATTLPLTPTREDVPLVRLDLRQPRRPDRDVVLQAVLVPYGAKWERLGLFEQGQAGRQVAVGLAA